VLNFGQERDSVYIAMPLVEFSNQTPSVSAPAAQEQDEFNTVGVQNAGESAAFFWYQTTKLIVVGLPNPVRHRLFAPFLPTPPAIPIVDPNVTEVPFGSITPNGEIALSGTATTDISGIIYYKWKTINDGTYGAPANLFLQPPTP
jgi:hypothetical protein